MGGRIHIDRRADQPAYKQLADQLRRQVRSGDLAPGALLPPESVLVRETGLNRTTVRNAIRVLRAEGLLEVVQGRGTFVRGHRLVRQRPLDALRDEQNWIGRLPPDRGDDLWLAVTGIGGPAEVSCDYRRVVAPPEVAGVLGRPGSEPLLRRQYVFYLDHRPHQVSWSYLPWELVAGTPAADASAERIHRGTLAQLADLGIEVTSAVVTVRTRMPAPEEVRLLDVGEGTPVFVQRRILYAGPAPVEVSDTTAPGDRLELTFTVDLPAGR